MYWKIMFFLVDDTYSCMRSFFTFLMQSFRKNVKINHDN